MMVRISCQYSWGGFDVECEDLELLNNVIDVITSGAELSLYRKTPNVTTKTKDVTITFDNIFGYERFIDDKIKLDSVMYLPDGSKQKVNQESLKGEKHFYWSSGDTVYKIQYNDL